MRAARVLLRNHFMHKAKTMRLDGGKLQKQSVTSRLFIL